MRSLHARLFLVIFAAAVTSGHAGIVSVSTDHPSGVYASGSKAVFTLVPEGSGPETAPLEVKILRDNRDVVQSLTIAPGETIKPISFQPPADGWYVCTVTPAGEKKPTALTGVIFNPDSFKPSMPAPPDFDAFWAAQKARLAASPAEPKLETLTSEQRAIEIQNPDHEKNISSLEKQGYRAVNLEIPCLDVKPLRAYFASPKPTAGQKHPAILFFRAAGVDGGWCRASMMNAMSLSSRYDALVVDLNAHGMLNGQPQEYYTALAKGELVNYQQQGKDSRDTFYFLGMFLRLQRAIDFLTAQPEWDGKNVICIGISQGGAQSLAAAGLDPRVNVVVATVPGMCDITGRLYGKPGAWPGVGDAGSDDPLTKRYAETVRYFDMVNFAPRSKAATLMTVGLVDTTCPPPGVYAAYNELKTEKRINSVPDKGHHALSTPNEQQRREQDEFIRAQLAKTP